MSSYWIVIDDRKKNDKNIWNIVALYDAQTNHWTEFRNLKKIVENFMQSQCIITLPNMALSHAPVIRFHSSIQLIILEFGSRTIFFFQRYFIMYEVPKWNKRSTWLSVCSIVIESTFESRRMNSFFHLWKLHAPELIKVKIKFLKEEEKSSSQQID